VTQTVGLNITIRQDEIGDYYVDMAYSSDVQSYGPFERRQTAIELQCVVFQEAILVARCVAEKFSGFDHG
jgi:hypothetical protein